MRANVLDFYVGKGEWEYNAEEKKYFGKDDRGKIVEIDIMGKVQGFDVKDFSDYYKYRVIIDYISGMTDKYAVSLFQKLSGRAL